MVKNRRILAQVLLEVGTNELESIEAIKVALRCSIEVGLKAQIQDLSIYEVVSPAKTQSSNPSAPHSEPSDRDQVIEEYSHCGLIVEIYRNAGPSNPPTYFATLMNPRSKGKSASVVQIDSCLEGSYSEVKKSAEDKAERRAFLEQKRLAKP